MAIEVRARWRAATLTLGYVFLCVAASSANALFTRVENASSQADEAMSKASKATDRADQNESDISELQDKVTELHNISESR